MAKFERKGKSKGVPPISTASLPDIVFMLLFFFMVSTTLKETNVNVRIRLPEATEVVKLEKKSLVSYIYVGEPRLAFQAQHGTLSKIQLDDKFSDVRTKVSSMRPSTRHGRRRTNGRSTGRFRR